ncbi:Peptidase S1, partial [Gonioctena quinquepunctata]
CLRDIQPGCHNFDPEAHLCTGPLDDTRKGVGFFDDGGPLVVDNKLAGIILHGRHEEPNETCHLSSIYAKAPYYKDFIDSHSDSKECDVYMGIKYIIEQVNGTDSPHSQSGFLWDYDVWYPAKDGCDEVDYEGITFSNTTYIERTASEPASRIASKQLPGMSRNNPNELQSGPSNAFVDKSLPNAGDRRNTYRNCYQKRDIAILQD